MTETTQRTDSANKQNKGARSRRAKIVARKCVVFAVAIAVLIVARPVALFFVIGSVVVLVGLLLRIWSFGYLQKNQSLITAGPYAHSRNPAYLGSAIAAVGIFIAAGSPYSWVGIAIWIAGLIGLGVFFGQYLPRKYEIEYTRLEASFGDEAREYARHVPHFFPRLSPWSGARPQRFSWSQVIVNNEWAWLPVCALALALIWFA